MKQVYHTNATTNLHIRSEISNSYKNNMELASQYNISTSTVNKWRKRTVFEDKTSRPHMIHYSMDEVEKALIISVRRSSWSPLDEVWDMVQQIRPNISRSAVYRTFVREKINKVPGEEREKAKKFKAYEPGYLHIDVTYLPKMDGKRQYLFVAIDRATRMLYYQIYEAKTADNAQDFVERCIRFFPFRITHILTDNGLEFTNALLISKKGEHCQKPSKVDEICEKADIDHRLTKPNTPKTNGMIERANGIIKQGTILKEEYADTKDMEVALMRFLIFYMLYRRHGSLKRELGVKTPFEAIEKWYKLKPEIFSETPLQFKYKILNLKLKLKQSYHKQPRET